jgi:hypothetical protein
MCEAVLPRGFDGLAEVTAYETNPVQIPEESSQDAAEALNGTLVHSFPALRDERADDCEWEIRYQGAGCFDQVVLKAL